MRLLPASVLTATALALAACGSATSADDIASGTGAGTTSTDRLDVAAGFYPYEFVTARVGGDDVTVTNLTKPGGEPHDLELTPRQVAELGEADLVVYSEGFQPAVDEAVEQQAADAAFDVLTVVEQQADAAQEEKGSLDPHVWLDPTRLATIAGAVADQLTELAPDKAAAFRARAAELRTELTQLDTDLRVGLSSCEREQVVTSHDAFGYLTSAYGLDQVAIAGLSPEDEASPKRLAEIAALAKDSGVTTIFFEELVSPKVAESLAREVDAETAVLTPLEGPPDSGDYVSAMRTNLDALRTALDCS